MHGPSLADALADAALRWLAAALQPYWPPPRSAAPSVHLLREDHGMLVYSLTLPPPGAADVARRELTQVVDGGAPTVVEATDGMELSYDDGVHVVLTLIDIDDAGNRSEPSPALEFDATDTLAPAAPGELGVSLLRDE
jgi:hypothetical protein